VIVNRPRKTPTLSDIDAELSELTPALRRWRWLFDRPFVFLTVYYGVVAATALGTCAWLGEMPGANLPESLGGVGPAGEPALAPPFGLLGLAAVIAMVVAVILMFPVAVIYVQTQRKPETLDESIIQTYIVLPLVVAGVVILVKSSLALAFSLAGIMAAVSFRNRLREPRDAVYIFLASAVGIAVGVRAFDVAFALSLLFNIAVLWLWATDFGGRAYVFAGPLAGVRAHRVAIADAFSGLHPESSQALTDEYVAQPADQVAVAANAEENGRPSARRPRYVLTVRAPDGALENRDAVEQVLEQLVRRWKRTSPQKGSRTSGHLEYEIQLRRKVTLQDVVAALRTPLPDVAIEVRRYHSGHTLDGIAPIS
jgi:hypothetical protein